VTKVFFATDIHGSDICWKKFINAGKFYQADVLVLGGDMTGKAIVPLCANETAIEPACWNSRLSFIPRRRCGILRNASGAVDIILTVQRRRKSPSWIKTRIGRGCFSGEVIKTLERWVDFAESKLKDNPIRCYVCPGNDDMPLVDEAIRSSNCIHPLRE
jgi:Icc-related predicted phosphoesterase